MEVVTYNVFHNIEWGIPIALYFYFTGISAGACHYSSIYTLGKFPKFKPLAFHAAWIALLGFSVTPILLVYDLGQPTRFWHFLWPSYFNPTSVMSWGSLLLFIYPIALVVYTWLLYKEDEHKEAGKYQKLFRWTSIIVLPLAIAVHAYTGFIFGVVAARGYWYSAIQPLYFLAGAIVSGFAILLLFAVIMRTMDLKKGTGAERISDDLVQTSRVLLSSILMIYPLFIFSHVAMMLNGPANEAAAGALALQENSFIWGDIILGVLTPIVLLLIPRTRTSYTWMSVAAVLALIGVLFARYSVVNIGQLVPLS